MLIDACATARDEAAVGKRGIRSILSIQLKIDVNQAVRKDVPEAEAASMRWCGHTRSRRKPWSAWSAHPINVAAEYA